MRLFGSYTDSKVGATAFTQRHGITGASHSWPVNLKLLDFGRVPYVSYGVKYIGQVSLDVNARLV